MPDQRIASLVMDIVRDVSRHRSDLALSAVAEALLTLDDRTASLMSHLRGNIHGATCSCVRCQEEPEGPPPPPLPMRRHEYLGWESAQLLGYAEGSCDYRDDHSAIVCLIAIVRRMHADILVLRERMRREEVADG